MSILFASITGHTLALDFMVVSLLSAISGTCSMILYWWVSPQEKLQGLKATLKNSQMQLSSYDGEFSGLWILVQKNLQLAMRRVGWSLGPTLIAGLPVILVFVAMDFCHNQTATAGATDSICQFTELDEPQYFSAINNSPEKQSIRTPVLGFSRTSCVSETQSLQTAVSPIEYLPFGPGWMRSWIFLFICSSTMSAIVVRHKLGVV